MKNFKRIFPNKTHFTTHNFFSYRANFFYSFAVGKQICFISEHEQFHRGNLVE